MGYNLIIIINQLTTEFDFKIANLYNKEIFVYLSFMHYIEFFCLLFYCTTPILEMIQHIRKICNQFS